MHLCICEDYLRALLSLAGLYEMPLQIVDSESSEEDDSNKIDAYLEQVLGFQLPGPLGHIVERKRIGSVSHTFSHIQLTLRVQLLIFKVSMTSVNLIYCSSQHNIDACHLILYRL